MLPNLPTYPVQLQQINLYVQHAAREEEKTYVCVCVSAQKAKSQPASQRQASRRQQRQIDAILQLDRPISWLASIYAYLADRSRSTRLKSQLSNLLNVGEPLSFSLFLSLSLSLSLRRQPLLLQLQPTPDVASLARYIRTQYYNDMEAAIYRVGETYRLYSLH